MIKAVFFDLDGTLLPMDLGAFLKMYIGGMIKHLAGLGYNPEKLPDAFNAGMNAMIYNDGERINESAFWDAMDTSYGDKISRETDAFLEYYKTEFDKARAACGYAPEAKEVLELLHEKGVPCVLATSPVYPLIATRRRMEWAGICESDFAAVTTFENSRFTKPNPKYYSALASELGYRCEECLMIGNDTRDDLAATDVGMSIFFLTNDLINRDNIDISKYPHGDFRDLKKYLNSIFD